MLIIIHEFDWNQGGMGSNWRDWLVEPNEFENETADWFPSSPMNPIESHGIPWNPIEFQLKSHIPKGNARKDIKTLMWSWKMLPTIPTIPLQWMEEFIEFREFAFVATDFSGDFCHPPSPPLDPPPPPTSLSITCPPPLPFVCLHISSRKSGQKPIESDSVNGEGSTAGDCALRRSRAFIQKKIAAARQFHLFIIFLPSLENG